MKSANTASSGNSSKPTPQTSVTPPPPPEKSKEEGLFSFPPPRPTDITEISAGDLLAVKGQTTLAQVSERLTGSLEKAGYQKNKYSYFWNDRDEFAIVTSMERVNFDGSNFTENNRWVRNAKDKALPTAAEGSYFKYLIQGKKVYYRVFAFIVTPSRNRQNLNRGDPPEFATAVNWKGKGEPDLGNGETTTVESVVWSEKYKCFALVYLFVNHTSLDLPKSVDSLEDSELRLQSDLDREAESHIKNIRMNLGG